MRVLRAGFPAVSIPLHFGTRLMAESSSFRYSAPAAAAAAISVFIFCYVALRAATLSITIDEAFTYSWHVTGDWWKILLFRTPGLPDNNHVLFTLLSKLSVALFGLSELTLRLPVLLGCIFYLTGLNFCLERIVPGWGRVFGLLLAGMNPYILDFLCLARGYGLALGFAMLGLAALLKALEEFPGKIRVVPAQMAIFFMVLAVLSHLSFMLFFGAVLLILSSVLVYSGMASRNILSPSGNPWVLLLAMGAFTLLLSAYLSIPVKIIHDRKLFEQGGHAGFWPDTVGSLIDGTIYDNSLLAGQRLFFLSWVILAVIMMPFAFWMLWRQDKKKYTALSIIVTIIGIICLESLLQHELFNIAWLQGRRGIFLIPLFLISALALGNLQRTSPPLVFVPAFLVGVVVPVLLIVHGFLSMNLRSTYDWKNCAGTRDAMLLVRQRVARYKPSEPLLIRSHWILEYGVNFYRRTMGLESLLTNTDGFEEPADFYYGYHEDEATITRYGARLLLRQQQSGTVLYESTGIDAGEKDVILFRGRSSRAALQARSSRTSPCADGYVQD
jgi:hypothetical protein